jgi:CheY-like chemotaxis protein
VPISNWQLAIGNRELEGVPKAWRPARRPASGWNLATTDPLPDLIMPKILYIEDTENNRILVERKLRRTGYDVVSAENAEAGLAVAARELPDLILMDMGLPGLDGWEATRRLKADPRLQAIPVIALTAHAMAGDRERSLEAGCVDYDVKPFDFDRLLEKIRARIGPGRTGRE